MLNARSVSSDATANANAARRLARRGGQAGGGLELVRPSQRVGQAAAKLGVVAGVAAGDIRRVALGGQPFGTVLAQRLEQPEWGSVTHVGKDHGLVDQPRHDVDDVVPEQASRR